MKIQIPRKIIFASDSFKGTLSQSDLCAAARRVTSGLLPGCEVVTVPIADGGEGSVDCFLGAAGGERVTVRVRDCLGRPADADYAILPDGKTAVIEVAAAAGLTLCSDGLFPLDASSFGVGQQMADALARGCTELVLCLGGSATTDAGCGMAAALGVEFFDADGRRFVPTGGTLGRIARVSGRAAIPDGVTVRALCDTSAVLYGPHGAAHVYAPQKGATPEEVVLLDDGLRHAAELLADHLSKHSDADLLADPLLPLERARLAADRLSSLHGGGAAGGIGAGVAAWFGGTLCPGIATFLELTGFRDKLAGADLVITGEGKLDAQSLTGKAVIGVSRACRAAGVRCVALVGMTGDLPGPEALAAEGLCGVTTTAGDPPRMPKNRAEALEAYENGLKKLLFEQFYCR